MKKIFSSLLSLLPALPSVSAEANYQPFESAIQTALFESAQKINQAALLVEDYVKHYAVLTGTTPNEEEMVKADAFTVFNEQIQNGRCAKTNLVSCYKELICKREIRHRYNTETSLCFPQE
jgi:hypothetical protein